MKEILTFTSHSFQWAIDAVDYIGKTMGLEAQYRIKFRHSRELVKGGRGKKITSTNSKSSLTDFFEGTTTDQILGIIFLLIALVISLPILWAIVVFFLLFPFGAPSWLFQP